MEKKTQKGDKNWLLWLILVLLLAGVIIWLFIKNAGSNLSISDLSISSSSKNSISLDVEAEGDGLKYYYSLDGVNFTEVDGPSFTIQGLSENTTYTVPHTANLV